ncbi:MAG: hypothetical protein HRT77_11240 [Halioglobus sp.]|nr:hypothetical protein [Halioglobus sp.]
MSHHTVAEELVIQLGHFGVKQILGITGDALNAFTNAIHKHHTIEWFTVRHEETAAFAAAAQAELTQALAVCAGTVGPGALHLVNGLYNAKRDRCPVLVITGHVPRPDHDGPYFQEVDIDKAFDDICVFNTTLRSPDQIARVLQRAISTAINQRGVAHLAIPTDIAVATIATQAAISVVERETAVEPDAAQIQALSALINAAERVSFLIGRGCRDAKSEVSELAKKLQAPIAHSIKGTECIEYDHPHSIGGIGHVGTPHGLKVLSECDLLLLLGTDFPYVEFLPRTVTIAQVDICAEHIGRRLPVAAGVVGDMREVLAALMPAVLPKKNAALKMLQKKREYWLEKVARAYAITSETTGVIHPQSVVRAVSELADADAVFCCDIGELTVWLARYLKMHGDQRLLSSFSHGSLGVALPAAIGAQALNKQRQVIAMSGDGGFGMLMADLVTAARYALPITQIIFNNAKFGFVELEMEAAGLPRFGTDLVNPDFAKVAEACGFEGITVRDPQALLPALTHALNTPKPVLIDVFVNPNELIIPSKIDPRTAYKFMQGKVKEMLIEKDIKVLFEH